MKRALLSVAAAAVLVASGLTTAFAGSGTSTLSVGTSVISNCTKMPTTFGTSFNYDVFSTNWSGYYLGNATINCTKGSSPALSFSGGNGTSNCGYGGSFNWCRYMSDGNGNTLNYYAYVCFYPTSHAAGPPQQYYGCQYMVPSGNYDNDQPAAAGNGSSERTYLYAYMGVQPSQDVPVGTYSDSFTMTLNY